MADPVSVYGYGLPLPPQAGYSRITVVQMHRLEGTPLEASGLLNRVVEEDTISIQAAVFLAWKLIMMPIDRVVRIEILFANGMEEVNFEAERYKDQVHFFIGPPEPEVKA